MFNIVKLKAENKALKEMVDQKNTTIMYLNCCISKANRRALRYKQESDALRAVLASHVSYLDFPNSQLEGQMSISDILEN